MMYTEIKEVIIQLHNLSNEMKLPIEDQKVILEWCRRGNSYNDEIAEKLIDPLYAHPDKQYYGIKVDENGKTIARKKTKDSEWEYL